MTEKHPRKRDATKTRSLILATARSLFSTLGFEATSIRRIASEVGVDAALVNRYFNSKEQLFLEASDLQLELPDLGGISAAAAADVLIPKFERVWETNGAFLALLRASGTSPLAAQALREVFADQVVPALRTFDPVDVERRAMTLATVIIGLAFTRYILQLPGLAEAGSGELIEIARPLLAAVLTSSHARRNGEYGGLA